MEFVEGEDLHHLLQRQGKLPAAEAVDIMEQVVSGLRAAHRVGIIHRDLKPGNIMLATDGRVLVMDFGLARSLESDGITLNGTMLGTMEYMSPEQAQAKDLDARSDIFTVGLILYDLLTGIRPYQAESAIASLLKRTQQRAIPVSDIDKNVPGVLSNIVSKCLERDPALRYQNADELLADLLAWQGKTGSSKVSVPSVGLWMNRVRELSWSRIAPVALLLVVMVAATAWYFSKNGTDDQKRIAEAYIAQLAKAKVFQRPIVTQVVPLKGFYPAETNPGLCRAPSEQPIHRVQRCTESCSSSRAVSGPLHQQVAP